MNLHAYRPGQEQGHRVIVERFKAAATVEPPDDVLNACYTAIVIPTRYGKSDVIRCSAIELYRAGLMSASLVLSPNRLLRDQLVDRIRVDEMFKRYQISDGYRLPYRALEGKPADLVNFTPNGEFLLSATMQLVTEHLQFFEHWVDHMLHQTGRPVLVYIDEAHTGSERNTWGDAVHRLVQHGARACLCTATPMRADGHRIPGFDFDVLEENHIKIYRTRDAEDPQFIIVDVFEGCKTKLQLKAHWTTTFAEAWDERPSPLCEISRLPFDVQLSELDDSTPQWLSQLSPAEAKQHLNRIVRTPQVLTKGAEQLVEQLRTCQKIQDDTAAIVFVGNDEDYRLNEHAEAVRRCIEKLAPSLDVVIATSSDGNEGTAKIEKFARGRGDVLIVKQMASLGLSIARLKVLLDLSTIRTPAAYIQRTMRIATPYPPHKVCIVITPDDCWSRALFEVLISDQGGEASAADLQLVDSYTKLREESPQRKLFAVDGTSDADFDDSQGVRADAELRADVDSLLSAIPQLLSVISHAQIAKSIVDGGLTIGHRIERSRDVGVEINTLHEEIVALAKQETMRRLENVYHPARYERTIKEVFTEAYTLAGVPRGLELRQIVDLALLKRIKRAFLDRVPEVS